MPATRISAAEARLSIRKPIGAAPAIDFLPRLERPSTSSPVYVVVVDLIDPIYDAGTVGSIALNVRAAIALRDGLASVIAEAWYAADCPPELVP